MAKKISTLLLLTVIATTAVAQKMPPEEQIEKDWAAIDTRPVPAWWQDAKFGLGHLKQVERLAVVGGPEWVAKVTDLLGHLTSTQVRTFPGSDLDTALDWIEA